MATWRLAGTVSYPKFKVMPCMQQILSINGSQSESEIMMLSEAHVKRGRSRTCIEYSDFAEMRFMKIFQMVLMSRMLLIKVMFFFVADVKLYYAVLGMKSAV